MTLVHVPSSALPSVERARVMLVACNTDGEVRRIRAIAQAVATMEKGKQLAVEAGKIIVECDTRRAELDAEERATRKKGGDRGNQHTGGKVATTSTLPKPQKDAESKRAPLRTLPERDRDAYFQACERANQQPTTASAVALAKLPPAERKAVLRGLDEKTDVRRAIGEAKKAVVRTRLESVASIEAKRVTGTYDVVVIDPPWPMVKSEREERPNQASHLDYPVMTEQEILDLPIPAARDCHLFLWTTQRFLPLALRCLVPWGFVYSCLFVWHKPGGFQPFGMPQFNMEPCVYARRGAPSFVDTKAFPVCFEAPRRRGGHSEKPEEFYETIRRVTAGRRIDMFNRRAIAGFEVWGKEAARTG